MNSESKLYPIIDMHCDLLLYLAEVKNANPAKKEVLATIHSNKTDIVACIENASGICEEDELLENVFTRLEHIIEITGRVFYISFTHHGENRFGGGNNTSIGLKRDGKMIML